MKLMHYSETTKRNVLKRTYVTSHLSECVMCSLNLCVTSQ